LVEVIADSYSVKDKVINLKKPTIVVLVGPSGSGKSKIAGQVLEKTDKFEKLVSYTTSDPTAVEKNEWYNYVNIETFRQMCESGEMFQSSMYAGHGYGSTKEDVEKILEKGKHVITTMDICGAMSLKTNFKNNVIMIYIKREKQALLASILKKNSSIEDKVQRIIATESEKQNSEICDYVVTFNEYDEAVEKLCSILHID
jgi:guanylate kinase